MRPWNPHGQTFHGEPITGVVPTGIRAHGKPMTHQQASYANAAFAAFCSRARLSVLKNQSYQGRLPDGTWYTIDCIAGVCACVVFTDGDSGPGDQDADKFYVDTGWLVDNFPEQGWPTRAQGGRYDIKSTGGSRSTWNGLRDLLRKYFVDTFENSSAKSGESFGNGITYAGLVGAALTNKMASDAIKLREKKEALDLIGRSSGLLRCWIKGCIGRRLRSESTISMKWEGIPVGVLSGFEVRPYTGGVLIGQDGFTYVQVSATECRMQPLALPTGLTPVWLTLREEYNGSGMGVTAKIMLATYLLAYAKPDPARAAYTVEFTEDVPAPFVGGWRFSLFSNKCVSVNVDVPDDWTAYFTGTELTFTEQAVDDGTHRFVVSVSDLGTERYYPTGSPVLWFPAVDSFEMHRFVLKPTIPPPIGAPNPILNAFYTQDDELTLVRANCAEYNTAAGWVTDSTTLTTSCGSGKSIDSVKSSYGTRVTREMKVSGGVSFTDARRSTDMEREQYRNQEVTGLTLRMDSTHGAWPGDIPAAGPSSGFCAVNVLGGASTPGSGYMKGYYGSWVRTTGDDIFSGSDTNVVLLTRSFAESQIWVRVRRGQVSGYRSAFGNTNHMFGFRVWNGDGQQVFDGFSPVSDSPGAGGGITQEEIVNTSESVNIHTRQSGAAVVLGGAGNQAFLSFESEGYDSGAAIEAYVTSGGTGIALPWLAECVQSAHMDAWATVCPNYDDEVVGGSGSGGFGGGGGGVGGGGGGGGGSGGADTNSIAGHLPIGAE